jgi:hypothetical protein
MDKEPDEISVDDAPITKLATLKVLEPMLAVVLGSIVRIEEDVPGDPDIVAVPAIVNFPLTITEEVTVLAPDPERVRFEYELSLTV